MSDVTGPRGPTRQAADTPSAGGRPPDGELDPDAIPVGLEHVLALAAAHPEFRQALRQDPDTAVAAATLELTPTERAIFRAIPPAALDQMIRRVDAGLTSPDRRRFLERASAALALLVGGESLLGCDSDKGKEYGKPKEPVQVRSKREHGDPRGAMDARSQQPPPIRPRTAPPPPTRPSPAEANDPPERPRRRPRQPRSHPASMGIRPPSMSGRPGKPTPLPDDSVK